MRGGDDDDRSVVDVLLFLEEWELVGRMLGVFVVSSKATASSFFTPVCSSVPSVCKDTDCLLKNRFVVGTA